MSNINKKRGSRHGDRLERTFLARYRQSDGEPQLLWNHLTSVSERTGQFAKKIGLETTGKLIGLVHDLGKATPEFLDYLEAAVNNLPKAKTVDHSTAGAQVLYEAFARPDGLPTIASDLLALTVASHHGFMDALTPSGQDMLGTRLSKDESETRKQQALANLPPRVSHYLQDLLQSNIHTELESVLKQSFEIDFTATENHFMAGLLTRFLLSCLIDADRLDAADFDSPTNVQTRQYSQYIPWSTLIERLESYLKQFEIKSPIDRMRREISEKCLAMAKEAPGIFRLSVPTGGGKTLASLRFALHHAEAHGMDRIIYVIPYTSIIDQNAQSIRRALGIGFWDTDIVLEHHSNLTQPHNEFEESDDYARYKLLAENWDSPIILTTMVQFLEGLYGSDTNSCRRMHQLSRSVVIFDEIQTLPINMVHLFNLAIKFLVNACGTSVMLCTATQPLLHNLQNQARSLPYDQAREITVNPAQKRQAIERVNVLDVTRPKGWSNREIAELALSESNGSKSVLVITNTKRAAAEVYNHVKAEYSGFVYHLSTSMCAAHRIDKLSEIIDRLKEKQPVILISTQLIEAGVDVDFDVVIRLLAGIDSIAQSAGRCNRHGKKPYKGRVILVNSNQENLSRLPDIAIARKKAERILEEFRRYKDSLFQDHLLSDPVLTRYFQYYFYERQAEMPYLVDQHSSVGRRDNLVDLLSYNWQSEQAYLTRHNNQPPRRALRQSFRSATHTFEVIPNSGHGVIVPYKQGEELISELTGSFEPRKQFSILRRAQKFSVDCFTHELKQLSEQCAIYEVQDGSGIFCLLPSYYHPELGWTSYRSGEMSTLSI